MSKEIMVVKREELLSDKTFQGFISETDRDYLSLILQKYEYQLRDEALEKNEGFKQIIPYVIIVNPSSKRVFGYKRFKKVPGLHEMRLHGKFSVGVGGHVDKEPVIKDVLTDATMRELREEVKMNNYPTPKIVGFVNDEKDSVGRVHFGIVAIAETNEEIKGMENDEVTEERFYSIEEVDSLMSSGAEMDGWTRIVWDFVKGYLSK